MPRKIKTGFILFLCAAMFIGAIFFYSEKTEAGNRTIKELSDLNGLTCAALAGTPHRSIIEANTQNCNILEFNSFADEILALKEGKIDFFVNTTIAFKFIEEQNPDLGYLDEELYYFDVGAIFPMDDDGNALRNEFNAFIEKIKNDGTLDEITDYWMETGDKENIDVPDSGPKGTISMVTCSTTKPFSFILNGKPAGFDIAIVAAFAKEAGYGLSVSDADFAGMLSGISTGKFDMAAGQISWTKERAEKVYYSDFYYKQILVPILRKADLGEALEYYTLESLKDVSALGSVAGSNTTGYLKEAYPGIEIKEYPSSTDCMMALEGGKIDAFMWDEPVVDRMIATNPAIGKMPELFKEEPYYFYMNKDRTDLKADLDEWIAKMRKTGYFDEKKEYWIKADDSEIKPVEFPQSGPKGIISAYSPVETRPAVFLVENELAGYPLDIFADFARESGYGVEVTTADVAGVSAAVSSGKGDIGVAFCSKTAEREKTLLFSEKIYDGGLAFVVRKAGGAEKNTGFFDGLKTSFTRSFIEENRWQLILNGLVVTLLITIFGFILANLFGALFCYMAMSKSRALRGISSFYSFVMQGTPMVVILMILYYVIFGNSKVSGVFVAIIGFGIAFGAYLSQTFEGAIRSVDKGQWEAALAMGFTKFQTFIGVIVPQAVRSMLPGYFSQLVSLMKGTAIVGYIAVADLTKAGDMIRSGTFEAFLPLILVSLVYLAITVVILSGMRVIRDRAK